MQEVGWARPPQEVRESTVVVSVWLPTGVGAQSHSSQQCASGDTHKSRLVPHDRHRDGVQEATQLLFQHLHFGALGRLELVEAGRARSLQLGVRLKELGLGGFLSRTRLDVSKVTHHHPNSAAGPSHQGAWSRADTPSRAKDQRRRLTSFGDVVPLSASYSMRYASYSTRTS